MNRYLAGILIGLLLVIVGEHLIYAQPVTQVVRLGDGTNLLSLTAAGAVKVDGSATTQPTSPPQTDPCQAPGVAKSSVVINATATAQLVALATSQIIYVCAFGATVNGTSPTMQFEYGTGAVCATSPVALTGVWAATAGNEVGEGFGGTLFSTAAGNALCIVIGGTSPTVQGSLTYVQK